MQKTSFKNLKTGDLVRPRRGELAGKTVEVIDIINNTIVAVTIDEVTVKRNDGVKLIFPYGYEVKDLYQMFSICH